MHTFQQVILASFVSLSAFAQSAPPRLEFEVASIKPAEAINGATQVNIGMHIDGAQVRLGYRSLQDLIRQAYSVKAHQVDGPAWLVSQRFDISAKLPAGATADQVPAMLQSLLADRFQLTYHRGSKDMQVLALVVGKNGLKMQEVTPGDAPAAKGDLNVAASGSAAGIAVSVNGSSYSFGDNKFQAKKMTMAILADTLSRFESDPVVDLTGLTGAYDFTLELTLEDYRAMLIRSGIAAGVQISPEIQRLVNESNGDSLAAAMDRVGLKLDRRKIPVDVLVVDKALKTPTEN
jgi:uncharacterized protein (TIGR03435 family)